MRTLCVCLVLCVVSISASAAIPKDGGYALDNYLGRDSGVGDGGMPFSGFELKKPLTAQGDFSKEEILPVVKAHQGEITACYHALLKRSSGKKTLPQGVAKLQFEVNPEGKVASAAIELGGVDEAVFRDCVVAKVKAWVFPPPRGGGAVKVAFPVKLLPPD